MQRFFIVVLSTMFFQLAAIVPSFAQIAKTNEVTTLRAGLKEMLQAKGAASLKKLSINVDEGHAKTLRERGVSASGTYTVYRGLDADGGLVGTVLIVNERGKEGPLQVLIAIDGKGELYDVGFTLFGEDKGKPALQWAYLRQFLGHEVQRMDAVQVDGISGATWTSESVATAIRRGTALYALFLADS